MLVGQMHPKMILILKSNDDLEQKISYEDVILSSNFNAQPDSNGKGNRR